ncbi:MAG: NAD(P)-dependent oxidoreductase, partial [Flavobacteriales bacterium]
MKVLFIDKVHPILQEQLLQSGYQVDEDYHCTFEELKQKISSFDGLVIRSRLKMNADLLNQAGRLKFIARSGAGLENIDLAAAKENKIQVFNSPEGNMTAVGEHALGMLLMLLNKLHSANSDIRSGLWEREKNRGKELSSMTVGLIGAGNMGQSFAQKLQGFGCRVLAYDKYNPIKASGNLRPATLSEVQTESNVISFHTPHSEETHHYFNLEFLEAMKKPFYLVNTARGTAVQTKSLLAGLKQGKILGAALDVLEYEPS